MKNNSKIKRRTYASFFVITCIVTNLSALDFIQLLPEFSTNLDLGAVYSDTDQKMVIVQNTNGQSLTQFRLRQVTGLWRLEEIDLSPRFKDLPPAIIPTLLCENVEFQQFQDEPRDLFEVPTDYGKLIVSYLHYPPMGGEVHIDHRVGRKNYRISTLCGDLTYSSLFDGKLTLGLFGAGGSGYGSSLYVFEVYDLIDRIALAYKGRPRSDTTGIVIPGRDIEYLEMLFGMYDDDLNEIYQMILSEFIEDEERESFVEAQRAWLRFRDAHIESRLGELTSSSQREAAQLLEKARMTRIRIKELLVYSHSSDYVIFR